MRDYATVENEKARKPQLQAKPGAGHVIEATVAIFLVTCLAILVFGAPFLAALAGWPAWWMLSLIVPPWWAYLVGSCLAITRYNGPGDDLDLMPVVCLLGSWLAWWIMRRKQQRTQAS